MVTGQPARRIAKQVIENFEKYDYIVAPSGSCSGMLKQHYPALFQSDEKWLAKAQAFC
jgi:L-lactate dehydrogenase complex protein LldE